MIFYHQGNKKKSNEVGVASGCLLLIGFSALIYFFTLLKDIDDVKEYLFQIIGVSAMAITLTIGLFSKKGKIANKNITIKDGYFKIDKVSIKIENIIVDYYYKNGEFVRYFLRDTAGKIAIYSVIEDELITYFIKNFKEQLFSLEETYHKYEGPYITVKTNAQTFYYDLDSGKYNIKKEGETTISHTPDVYDYDANYKLGKPLFKK